MKIKPLVSVALRLLAAVIMLQTLYFKFTGSEESVYIFSSIGLEPWGRIGTGVAELIAALMLLYRPTVSLGALMGLGIMSGALFTHLAILGVEVKGDGGLLFYYCLVVLVSCAILLVFYKNQLFSYISRLKGKRSI